jgi:hypothetical protein
VRRTATPTLTPVVSANASIIRGLSPLSFTLNGRDQVAQTTMVVAVSDLSLPDRQPGWALSLTMDQFHVTGAPAKALPRDAVTLAWVSFDCIGGECAEPHNSISYPLATSAGKAVTFLNAAPGSGRGEYTVTLTFEVEIPGNAYAGNYITNIAVAIAGGQAAPPPSVAALVVTPPPATATPVAAPEPTQVPVIMPTATIVPTATAVAPPPTPLPTFPATDRIGTTQAVNLRSGPGVTFPTLGALRSGTPLAATGETRVVAGVLWRCFALADGRVGWVRDSDVLPVAP